MSWYFFGGVSAYAIVPSRRTVNHSRRGLQREVQRDLHAEVAGAVDEGVEVVEVAQLGVDRVVAAVGGADRPRRADVARLGDGVAARHRGAVRALAVNGADRVDRGQVDHVEAHRRDAVELLGRRGEVAVHRAALGVDAAGRAGEELVPRAEQGTG